LPVVNRSSYLPRQLLVAIGGLTILLLVLALPDLAPPSDSAEPVTAFRGRIVEILRPGEPLDPDDPNAGFAPDVMVEISEGPRAGERVGAYLQGPSGQQDLPDYGVGEDIVVSFTGQPETGDFVAVTDRWRLPTLGLLLVVFGVAVVLKIVIPLLLQGVPPVPLAVVVASAVTLVTILLTEGLSRASVAAICGTFASLALTAVLAALATGLAAFTNAAGSDLVYLQTTGGAQLDLRGLLLAAFIFGSLGVLDDVTVTQAAAVQELGRGGLAGGRLFLSAMNVGRSHIAATVNTLFLAYVGASRPLLVLYAVARQPAAMILNGEVVAVEIVRAVVGSLGIVTAVPLTTAIATWLAQPRRRRVAHATEPGVP